MTDEEIIERGLKAKAELIKILRAHSDIYLKLTGIDKKWGRFRHSEPSEESHRFVKDANWRFVSINDRMMSTGYCPEYVFVPYKQYKN